MKIPANDPQQIITIPTEEPSIKCYKQIIPVTFYHYYIVEELKDVGPYLDLINTLKTAETHDSVYISLNSPGGDLDTAIQIISAMRQAQCQVVCANEGTSCSAASLIFLSGKQLVVNPHTSLMIHSYSSFFSGKSNEISSRIKYTEEYFRELVTDIYKGFLSSDEIERIINGHDLWLSSSQIIKRLQKTGKISDSNEKKTKKSSKR